MNSQLATTFGEAVTHSPIETGTAQQEVTMTFIDPTSTGETIPGVFAVLAGPLDQFDVAPVEGDLMTFRGEELLIFSPPALLANGVIRVVLTRQEL